jgi:hypothetical protein
MCGRHLGGSETSTVTGPAVLPLIGRQRAKEGGTETVMSILWIILIVILVLALLGFFSRGSW